MSLNFLLRSFEEEGKADKGEISLTGLLQRKRLALSRTKGPRKASLDFSPYNIGYGFCMREKVAQLAGYHEIWIKNPTPKEQLIFDVGHKFHDIIQGYFYKLGILEGQWLCTFCDFSWWDRSPKKCPSCYKIKHIVFREVKLIDKTHMISGRADGIIWLEVGKKVEEQHLVDIKSISNKGRQDNPLDPRLYFEDLDTQGPPQHHIVQLMIYQKLSNIHDAHLLYVAKSSQQMKSFHIKYKKSVLDPYLDTIQEAIDWSKELKEGIRLDLPPPCSSAKCACGSIVRTKGGD